jgi:hypothetical protein
MNNLEPITEEDLNLESKFGKIEPGKPFEEKESLPKLEKEPAEEIISAEKEDAYSKILSKVQSQSVPVNGEEVKNDAQKTFEKQDAQSQLQHLVDIASSKGVLHAVNVARHMEDNYILDMFHDKLLSDELHDALMEKGLIDNSL